MATIIPLSKPGKPTCQGSSYRPISLLCPSVKIFERLLLPELNSLPLSDTQHGFRQHHSTTTALLPLAHKVALGFNQPRPPHRTVTVSIDFSKAFDTVSHTSLISSLTTQTTLRHNTVRWLSAYLRGRMTSCLYNNTKSPHRHARTGVPQGSCISPVLFNFFVSSYPPSPQLTSSYADDFTDSFSSPDIQTAVSALTTHSDHVVEWARERGLTISAPKSSVTLFTSHTHQSHTHPTVSLDNTILPLERNPRILGVTFDPHFTFTPHINSIISRATPRLNILRALAGTTWGASKETLIITFKSLIQSLFTYASPVWFPNASPSAIAKLQIVQNSALRTATGCVKMASSGHLHAEALVLPVHTHLSLLSSQFLARTLLPSHPSHLITTAPSGPRNIKNTLQSRFFSSVSPYLVDNILPPDSYKQTIQSLHTSAVASVIAARPPNRVLSADPPPIAEEEKLLPRAHRSTLSQLRSGFSPALNSYLERVGRAQSDLCPSCLTAPHTTSHLFSCPSHPTNLGVRVLWNRPCLTIAHISGLPTFTFLPPLIRPPPEPPPDG